jgi:glucokinase
MEIEMIKSRVVGVDISGAKTTIGIVDIRGNVIVEETIKTLEYGSVAEFVNKLCETIITLVERNGGYETIRSVGVSAPSANYITGSIVNAANMPWQGVIPLAAMMRDQLGLAVCVANDAHAAAMGEKVYGSAHGMKNFIIINLGAGMGSCIFSDGHVHLGAGGFAGEIGHTCVKPGGRLCGCGHHGCLETYVNAKGIVKTAHEVLAESDQPSLMRDLEHLSPRTIKDCCDRGDELAIEVYRRTGEMLGLGLANCATVLDPEAIIFTGGISLAGKWLIGPARETFERLVFPNTRGKVKMLMSILHNGERDMLGASAVAWDVEEYSLFK